MAPHAIQVEGRPSSSDSEKVSDSGTQTTTTCSSKSSSSLSPVKLLLPRKWMNLQPEGSAQEAHGWTNTFRTFRSKLATQRKSQEIIQYPVVASSSTCHPYELRQLELEAARERPLTCGKYVLRLREILLRCADHRRASRFVLCEFGGRRVEKGHLDARLPLMLNFLRGHLVRLEKLVVKHPEYVTVSERIDASEMFLEDLECFMSSAEKFLHRAQNTMRYGDHEMALKALDQLSPDALSLLSSTKNNCFEVLKESCSLQRMVDAAKPKKWFHIGA
ncbi:MAG: hypothetical protein Q9227_001574 [Pyrenula ochraceoflavens]